MNAGVRWERPHFFLRAACKTTLTFVLLFQAASHVRTAGAQPVDSAYEREPRINGPSVYGARPHHPFLYRIPAIGVRPLHFSASGLPAGLILNPESGIISGVTPPRGKYDVTLTVRNSRGESSRKFRIAVGDTLALTPPMGWSSWYMSYLKVSDALIRAQAEALLATGLADHGYSYVNIDDGWNIDPKSKDPGINGSPREANGDLRPNANFPDMKGLTDYLHTKGLKAGIYISPGPHTCGGYEGSFGHERQDAQLFARWGFDFLKYDLCSYQDVVKGSRKPEDLQKPYALMGSLLKSLDRDFVFNLCEYGFGNVWEWGREVGGNFWRTADDVGSGIDGSLWKSMDAYGFGEAGREKWAGPGGWNDPDNILLGQIMWQDKLVPTPLTKDEQYTWMTLWSMLSAPLVLGNDLTKMDDFTLALLTNDEVIAVNQDALGRQAIPVERDGQLEIWVKDLEDGSRALAVFNRGGSERSARLDSSSLHLTGPWLARDLWEHKDAGAIRDSFELRIAQHGTRLFRIWQSQPQS
jgi:alpha-galactosidase